MMHLFFLLHPGGFKQGFVPLGIEVRQTSKESDNGPHLFLGMGYTEGGHSRHLEPVIDNPLKFGIFQYLHPVRGQERRRRIKTLCEFLARIAGRTMAQSAHGMEVMQPQLYVPTVF